MSPKLEFIMQWRKEHGFTPITPTLTQDEENHIYELLKNNDLSHEPATIQEYNYWGHYHLEITKNDIEIKKWYMKAIKLGHVGAMFNLGYYYQQENKPKKSSKWYRKAANLCDDDAMNNLGVYYNDQKNKPNQAKKWWLKSAKLGNNNAMNNLGTYYHNKNKMKQATKWWLNAAKLGNNNAMNNLGTYYHNKNKMKQSTKWWLKAATLGHSQAMDNLKITHKGKMHILYAKLIKLGKYEYINELCNYCISKKTKRKFLFSQKFKDLINMDEMDISLIKDEFCLELVKMNRRDNKIQNAAALRIQRAWDDYLFKPDENGESKKAIEGFEMLQN